MIMGIIALVILAFSYLFEKNTKYNISSINIKRYILFLVVMTFSFLVNNDISDGYIRLLFGYHLIGIIGFLAIARFINDEKGVKILSNVLVLILVANAIVTILQFYNVRLGWEIGYLFSETSHNLLNNQDGIIGGESLFDGGIQTGIMGNVVINGYIFGCLSVLILPLMRRKKFIGITFLVISFAACIVCQQRAAFFLLTFALLLISFRLNKNILFKYVFVLLFIGIFIFLQYFININLGRITELQDDTRERLLNLSIEFVQNNIMWGGLTDFIKLNGTAPHNIIFNAFVYAGLIGGIIATIIIYSTFSESIKVIAKTPKISYSSSFAYSILIFWGVAMTHNPGFVTGDEKIWILYALFLKSKAMGI